VKIVLVGLRLAVGTRLIIDTLGAALTRLGHQVVFVGEPHTPPAPLRAVVVSGAATYPAMLAQTLSPAYHRAVVNAVSSERPDLCYFCTVHPANGMLCREIRRAVRSTAGRPPVIAVQIHDPLPHPGVAWPLIFSSHWLMARAADRVVAFGQALAEQIARFYGVPHQRIVVIPHGASRPPRDVPPADGPHRHFSFLGRIDGYKGLDIFLTAARRFLGDHPDARFYVGGGGSLRPYRRAIDEVGGSVTVENRELTNDETDRVMQASWAVVLPYTSGTQSGVIPVAYWNACPVITTRVGALPELVRDGENGFLVGARDAQAVADKMGLLWGNGPLRRAMGLHAFTSYERTLRWDTIAGQLVAGLTNNGRRETGKGKSW
jgi:glycosyltransferase involved in cell wall biosynthesis